MRPPIVTGMAIATGEKLGRKRRPNLLREGIEELPVDPVLPVTKRVPATDNGGAQAGSGVDFDVIGKIKLGFSHAVDDNDGELFTHEKR